MIKFWCLSLFFPLVGQFSFLANGLGIDFSSHADTTKFPGRVSGVINKIFLHKAAGTDGAYVVEVVVPIGAVVVADGATAVEGQYRIVMNRDITDASGAELAVNVPVAEDGYGIVYSSAGFTDRANLDKLLVFRTTGMDTSTGIIDTAGVALQVKTSPTEWKNVDAMCFAKTFTIGTYQVCPEDAATPLDVAEDYFHALGGNTAAVYVIRSDPRTRGRRLYFVEAEFSQVLYDVPPVVATFNKLAVRQLGGKLVQATDLAAKPGIDFSSEPGSAKFPGRVSGRITKVYARPSILDGNNVADKLTGFQVEVLLPKDSVFGTATGNYRVRANLMSSVDNSKVVPIGTLVTQTSQSIDIDNALVADTFYKDPSGLDELFVIKSGDVELPGLNRMAITLDTTTDDGATWKHLDSLCFLTVYYKGNAPGFCAITDTSVGGVEVVAPWFTESFVVDTFRLFYRKGKGGRRLGSLRGLYFVEADFDATLGYAMDAKTIKFGAITADQSGTSNTLKPDETTTAPPTTAPSATGTPSATTAPSATGKPSPTTAAPATTAPSATGKPSPTTAAPATIAPAATTPAPAGASDAATAAPTTTSGATTAVSLSLTGVALTALLALI